MNKSCRTRPAAYVAQLGVCLALCMVLSYAETLIPPFTFAPGIRVGLPNLVILYLLYRQGFPSAVTVSLIRVGLSSVLFGSLMSFTYSLAGAVCSLFVMWLLHRADFFSPLGVSVSGAVVHNLAQVGVAALWLGSGAVFWYLPVLIAAGTVAGTVIGTAASIAIRRIPVRRFKSSATVGENVKKG